MSNRLTPPERFDIPDEHRTVLRSIVLSEISPRRSARRIGRRALVVSVALFVLTTVSVAGAALLRTEFDRATEVFPEDRAEVIARLGSGIPLPPGGSFEPLIDVDYTEDETGLAGTLAFNAWCQWTGLWIDGTIDGDPARQREASEVMDRVPTWPQLTAIDGGGVTAGLAGIATAATQGDIDAVVRHYQINCTGVDPERDADLMERWTLDPGMAADPGPFCEDLEVILADLASGEATDPVMMMEKAVELAVSGPEQFQPLVDLLEAALDSGDVAAALPGLENHLDSVCVGGS